MYNKPQEKKMAPRQIRLMEEERLEFETARHPDNHAFVEKYPNTNVCWYCEGKREHHKLYVDCSTGTREVKKV